jgi:iron complex transport system permease protein
MALKRSKESCMGVKMRPGFQFLVMSVLWVVFFSMSLRWGVYQGTDFDVIREIRLPRAVLATAVGAGLALSGATLQALYANPLCDPYILGVSSGAALGAVIGITLGIEWSSSGVALPALLGALIFTVVLQASSRLSVRSGTTWVLFGVLMGSLGSSLVSIWMTVAEPSGVQNLLFWMLGDLSRARLSTATAALGSVLFLGILLWRNSRLLDALLLGESGARSLGVETTKLRSTLIFIMALLVAICVSCAGMIGFVGLVVPHFARLRVGAIHARMLPFCAIAGAGTMLVADLASRTVFMPYELPVGAITALFGAPCLMVLIFKLRRNP